MKFKLLLFAICIALLSCEKEKDESYPPSVIEFELQTFGDLSGGIFGEKHTLTRKTKEYQADDEHGTYSSIKTYSDGNGEVIDIVGWGNSIHPQVKKINLRIPSEGVKTYTFNPETSSEKAFWLFIETTYQSRLEGGYAGRISPETKLSVTITEVTDDRIKGSFTGDLVYYNIETIDGAEHRTIDEEITNRNKPLINGTFDVFKERY